MLTPPLPGQRAEVSLHTLAPGAATGGPGDPPMHEPGSRETAVVTDGAVRLVCDGGGHDLDSGDAVTFDADLPHHFENHGPGRRALLRRRRGRTEEELTDAEDAVRQDLGAPTRSPTSLLYIDLHLVHEVTSPQAFEALRLAGRKVRRPDRTLATADHNVPTDGSPRRRPDPRPALARAGRDARAQLRGVRRPDLLDRLRRARASST